MSKRGIKDIYQLQQKADELFSKGLTQSQVAQELDVSTRTLRRWQKNPQSLVKVLETSAIKVLDHVAIPQKEEIPHEPSLELKEAQVTQSAGTLQDVLPRRYAEQIDDLLQLCLDTLNRVLSSPDISPGHQLAACKIVREMKQDSMLWVEKIEIGDNVSDFQLVQTVLRQIILRPNVAPKIIQAATVLLKLCQLQVQIPSLVVPDLEEEYLDLRSLSDDELARRYAQVMSNGKS